MSKSRKRSRNGRAAVRVRWLRVAERNLDEIGEYIAADNPDAAARNITKILAAIDLLPDHPAIGRAGRVAGTRELVVPDTPYLVAYRVRANAVEILRILHGARKWPDSV